jgi:hypothetical protein
MESFPESMDEYRKQLEKGVIQQAYRGLMEYVLALRARLAARYPTHVVTGLYQGYMDMTYFSFTPASLASRKLKIAIVFVYDTFRFEAWLAAQNKNVQSEYLQLFKDNGWSSQELAPEAKGYDHIVCRTLIAKPDFSYPDALTGEIEKGILSFIGEIERFLSKHAKTV